jgi:hypothetical protein
MTVFIEIVDLPEPGVGTAIHGKKRQPIDDINHLLLH